MTINKQNTLYISFIFILTSLFLLFFSEATSPITDRNTIDSTIFISMGKMFLDGKIPYLEYFDHKGPSLILLEAFGQLFIRGRSGVFIMQIINLFVVLFIISKTADILKFGFYKKLILCILSLYFVSNFMNRGNTGEELSFIPLIFSLYVICRIFFETKRISALDGFYLGLCASFLFWLRANNAGFIGGVCFFLFFTSLYEKDYKSFKNLMLYFFVGLVPLSAIYLLFFWYHEAVYELIYATFLFNMNYVTSFFNMTEMFVWINITLLAILAVATAIHFINKKNGKVIFLSFSLFLFTSLSVNMGYNFAYYFLLYLPLFVYSCILIMDSIENKKIVICILTISCILLGYGLIKNGYYIIKEGSYYRNEAREEKAEFMNLLSKIPSVDLDKILYYNIYPTIFLYEGVTSNYKYCFIQEWHGRHDVQIVEEINNTMVDNSPKYVMINAYEGDENKEFVQILKEKYTEYARDEHRVIFKKK